MIINVNSNTLNALLDSGAAVSLIKEGALAKIPSNYKKEREKNPFKIQDVNGKEIKCKGLYYIRFNLGTQTLTCPFIACRDVSFTGEAIIGSDIMRKTGMTLDFAENQLKTADNSIIPFNISSPTPNNINVIRSTRNPRKHCYVVTNPSTLILEPYTSTQARFEVGHPEGENLLVTPKGKGLHLYKEGLFTTSNDNELCVRLDNTGSDPIIIEKNEGIGEATVTDVVEYSPPDVVINSIENKRPVTKAEIMAELEPHVVCEEHHRAQLLELLASYRDVVALPGEPLGRTHLMELALKLQEGTKPISLAPYKIPHSKEAILDTELQRLLDEGIIQPTISPWAFPVVLVAKPDKTVRLCVDYRRLNAVTESDDYPLPVIQDIIMNLGQSEVFSQLDLVQAFHQVPLAEATKPLTAFKTAKGHYSYNVCPFGLKQIPAVFQRLMNTLFQKAPMNKFIKAYLDDLLINSENIGDHIGHLSSVLQKLREAKLKIKLKKSKFFQKSVKFLGFTITNKGFHPMEDKVEAVSKFPTPKTVDNIRAFLGLAGYYRCYVKNFSSIASPLSNLLKLNKKFEWTAQCEEAFNRLKSLLSTYPILAYPNYNEPFFLETDASNIGLGCVLSQVDPKTNKLRPISYASRLLNKPETNYSTTDKEALAIVWGLKKYRYVIYGYRIHVLTDHKPLTSLFTKTLPPGRLGRWALLVQEFGIKITYKAGKFNEVPDALSRNPYRKEKEVFEPLMSIELADVNPDQVEKIKNPISPWSLTEIAEEQQKDPEVQEVCRWLSDKQKRGNKPSICGHKLENFKLSQGILYYSDYKFGIPGNEFVDKIFIPDSLTDKLMTTYHDHVTAGHRGTDITLKNIRKNFTASRLSEKAENHQRKCHKCQVHKRDRNKPATIFEYPVAPKPFHTVHMDILGGFPKTKANKVYIIVYVDRFTRFTIVDSLPDRKAETVADSFITKVITPFTTPKVLISDNALEFTSTVIKEVCAKYGISNKTITAYHPAANGLAEAANQRVLNTLRVSVSKTQDNWDKVLPYVQTALNNQYHEAVGETPHFLVFLQDKILPSEVLLGTEDTESTDYTQEMLSRQRIAHEATQQCLEREQSKYITKSNKKTAPSKIKPGFRVFLQTRKLPGKRNKLSPKYEGPYRVTADLGSSRFKIICLRTGTEKTVHADHIKTAPEGTASSSKIPLLNNPTEPRNPNVPEKISKPKNPSPNFNNLKHEDIIRIKGFFPQEENVPGLQSAATTHETQPREGNPPAAVTTQRSGPYSLRKILVPNYRKQ